MAAKHIGGNAGDQHRADKTDHRALPVNPARRFALAVDQRIGGEESPRPKAPADRRTEDPPSSPASRARQRRHQIAPVDAPEIDRCQHQDGRGQHPPGERHRQVGYHHKQQRQCRRAEVPKTRNRAGCDQKVPVRPRSTQRSCSSFCPSNRGSSLAVIAAARLICVVGLAATMAATAAGGVASRAAAGKLQPACHPDRSQRGGSAGR